MKNYKTIHENKNDLEQFNAPKEIIIKLPEKLNMDGIQEFLDNQTILNTNPYSIEQQVKEQMQDFKRQLLKLDKYECTTNSGGQDCWATMEIDKDGEYVKIEDILNLFSAQKQ